MAAVIDQLFHHLIELGGSDLHIAEGQPPKVRVHGGVRAISEEILTHEYMEQMMTGICDPRAWEKFLGQGLEAKFPLAELQQAGVSSVAAPPQNMLYGLIDLQNGSEATEYSLASNNFFAITQYNRSYFYAMSVIDLGKAVSEARAR